MRKCGLPWGGARIVLLLGLFLGLVLEAPADAAPAIGQWQLCDGPPWQVSSTCTATALHDVDPQGRMIWLTAEVRFDRSPAEPMAVFVSAYASSALYWDGRLVGMNGSPAERAGLERPGLRDAAFQIEDARPGTHRLALLMSSHHGLLRLRSPVTRVSVPPFERASSMVMRGYLPAMISAGGLLVLVLIFAAMSWSGQHKASRFFLTGAALFATAQLFAEASRAFLDLPYPLLFLRILLVLAFAAGFGFMLLAYIARRFEVARLWPVLSAQALAGAIAVISLPSFDQRTGLVLASAIGIGMLLAIRGATRSAPGALPIIAMLAVGLCFSLAAPYSFLDRDFYLWTAGLFVLLFAEETRRARRGPAASADPLDQRPPQPVPATVIPLGTGASKQFVRPADIVRLAAADDYTEAFLIDGRAILHPEPLQRLVERLPSDFLRVHRSHAINLSHLRSFRRGRVSSVLLSDDSMAPVSRRSVARLVAALAG